MTKNMTITEFLTARRVEIAAPPTARFRAEGEPPDEAVVAVTHEPDPPTTYTVAPTNETCSLHPCDPLWWVEMSTGEEALWCDRCTTSNLPARPHVPFAPRTRYTWRAFIADLKEAWRL
jgi:hypothetical protein